MDFDDVMKLFGCALSGCCVLLVFVFLISGIIWFWRH